jgi:hypothetical protein
MSSGIERIAAERQRQIEVEGWTPEHDDQHDRGQLGEAATCYGDIAVNQVLGNPTEVLRDQAQADEGFYWPLPQDRLKISDDPVRNLEKAGALIAAEIDRLLRARAKKITVVERRPE